MKLEIASKEEMQQEAIRRMKILNLHNNVINDLKKERVLNRSEGPLGSLYWLNKEEKKMVEDYAKQCNVFVYHIIKTYTVDMGSIYDLLFFTEEKYYWKEERERLKEGYALSHTISQFSENGDIFVKNINGGLVRIY